MTKFRWHRGGYEESMSTTVEVRNFKELRKIILLKMAHDLLEADPDGTLDFIQIWPIKVKVHKAYLWDYRNDWNTHIVTADGQAVGFTDGPL